MDITVHQKLRSSSPIDESTQESLFLDAAGDILKAYPGQALIVGKQHTEVGGTGTDADIAFLAWVDANLSSVSSDAEIHRTEFGLQGPDGNLCDVVIHTMVVSE
jgi:hypothetical protein